jgi:dipeptidyl aminopeptidase/acylaminoacyl peptidase
MSAPLANVRSRERLIGADASPALERAHSPHLHVRADSPPCFLLHAEDDDAVPVGNSLALREALKAKGIPVETHLFPDGGHGFGIRLARGRSVEHWPELLLGWARHRGLWA